MTIEESISAIKELLNRFPGVTVVSHWRTQFVLYVDSHESLVLLARCCMGGIPAPGNSELRYALRLSEDLPWVEAFGIYLVDALLKRGLMERPEAEALAVAWNSTLVV